MKALGLVLATAVVGTAGSTTDTPVFTRADGSRIAMPGKVSVFCGPWESDPTQSGTRAPSLHVEAYSSTRRLAWELVAVMRDVHAGTVVRLPHSPLSSHPTKALMFVNDGPPQNEASSATETARGTIRFRAIGCKPAHVDAAVDAKLGSEFFEGPSVRVRENLRAGR